MSLGAGDRANSWIRITLRIDFTGKKWDLSANGTIVAYDVGFQDSSKTFLSLFKATGHTATDGFFDYFYVGGDNPLFVDGDRDGMEDAWETAKGLNPALIDRNGDPDADGLTNIEEFKRGTNPSSADTDGDGLNDAVEVFLGSNPAAVDTYQVPLPVGSVKLHLRSDQGLVVDGAGRVSQWRDMSGLGNHANAPGVSAQQPLLVANAQGGRPALRFNKTGFSKLTLPNLMNGAAAGEVFIVLKAASDNDGNSQALWRFGGTGSGATYPSYAGQVNDDFGSTSMAQLGDPVPALNTFNLYNVSSQSGAWTARLNGLILTSRTTNTVGWPSAPTIGEYPGNGGFNGDIAEIVIYDRVLTATERQRVGEYLTSKYQLSNISLPTVVTGLTASAASSTQVNLNWSDSSPALGVVYTIERQTNGGSFSVLAEVPGSLGYFDSGLIANTSYGYRVKSRTYAGATAYSDVATVTTPVGVDDLPLNGQRLWLRADAGVPTGVGKVPTWFDQSGFGNNAANPLTPVQQPTLLANVLNGKPVVRFSKTGFSKLTLPNLMNGAAAGEVFIVLKAASDNDGNSQALWRFGGTGSGTAYPANNGQLSDDFGSTSMAQLGDPTPALNTFNLYNVSSQSGEWIARLNGAVLQTRLANTVSWPTAPTMGEYPGNGGMNGDIAEVLVYNRVLSSAERLRIGQYLTARFQLPNVMPPSNPASLTAVAVSSSQVSVGWIDPSPVAGIVYVLERQVDGGSFSVIAEVPGTVGYFDSGLTAGVTYGYRVKARTYAGESAYSGSMTVTTPTNALDLPMGGQRLWLRADAGIPTGPGRITSWSDQSGLNNHAIAPAVVSQQPTLVNNVVNGKPVVRFAKADASKLTFPSFMNGAAAGEVFVVLKAASDNDGNSHALWKFGGTGSGAAFPKNNGQVGDDFGSSVMSHMGDPIQPLNAFNLYNVTTQAGTWMARLNGTVMFARNYNTVSWPTAPTIGEYPGNGGFSGDIAEIIVYDRVLSSAERFCVGQYLAAKFQISGIVVPSAPTGTAATSVSSSQVVVTWSDNGAVAGSTYVVERQTGGGVFTAVTEVSGSLSYLDSGLSAGASYTYRVKTKTYAGESAYGNMASVTLSVGASDLPVAGQKLWLKADAGVTTGAGRMLAWLDQSGLGNDAIAALAASQQPLWVQNGIGTRPVVRFSAANQQYFTLPLQFLANTTAGEMYVVAKTVADVDGANHAFVNVGAGQAQVSYYPSVTGDVVETFATTQAKFVVDPPFALNTINVYNVSGKSGEWFARFNGALHHYSGSNTYGFRNDPTISNSNEGFSGDIAEIIIYDRMLSGAERAKVCAYLGDKYGVAFETPIAPAGMSAQIDPVTGNITINWVGGPFALSYLIERRIDTGTFVQIGESNSAPTFIDASAPAGDILQYRIRSVGTSSMSAYSRTAFALRTPNTINPTSGLPYRIEVALGLDPTADNSAALPAVPNPVSNPPPTLDPNDHTGSTVILVTPAQASLN